MVSHETPVNVSWHAKRLAIGRLIALRGRDRRAEISEKQGAVAVENLATGSIFGKPQVMRSTRKMPAKRPLPYSPEDHSMKRDELSHPRIACPPPPWKQENSSRVAGTLPGKSLQSRLLQSAAFRPSLEP